MTTDMSREAIEGAEGAAIRRAIPLGRPGTPEEVAGPISGVAEGEYVRVDTRESKARDAAR